MFRRVDASISVHPLFPEFGMLKFEKSFWSQGCKRVAGIDEAGRGPLAGPVVAACCMFPQGKALAGVRDSKQLTAYQREELYEQILAVEGASWGIGIAESSEIDRFNILRATFLAMSRALSQLSLPPDMILIDGSLTPSFGIPTFAIVKGDSKSHSIAAASILAKVTRDRLMAEYDAKYPQYGFKEHKGYGTPEHVSAIRRFGPCAIHRMSFDPLKQFAQTEAQAGFDDLFDLRK